MALHHIKKSEKYAYIVGFYSCHAYARMFRVYHDSYNIEARIHNAKLDGTWQSILDAAKRRRRTGVYKFPSRYAGVSGYRGLIKKPSAKE